MSNAPSIRTSPPPSSEAEASPLRRPMLAAWGAVIVFAAFGFLFLNLNWESRAEARFRAGEAYYNQNSMEAARDAFVETLDINPGHPKAHRLLGDIHDKYLGDDAHALYHYHLHLQQPGHDLAAEVRARISLLNELVKGEVEDPMLAATELLAAARERLPESFRARVSPALLQQFERNRMSSVSERVWASWDKGGYADEPGVFQRAIFVRRATTAGGPPTWLADLGLNWRPGVAADSASRRTGGGQIIHLRLENGRWLMIGTEGAR